MTGTEGCCAHLSVLASELENRAGRPLITVWLEVRMLAEISWLLPNSPELARKALLYVSSAD